MQFRNKLSQMTKVQRLVFISILAALALVLSFYEAMIPIHFTFPGVKLGLANVVILCSLYFFSFGEVLLLSILRIGLGSLFTSPISFFYSLSGGLMSLIVMFLLIRFANNKMSPIGISVVGSVFHNIGQLMVVAIITQVSVALSYFPILAVSGIVTGVITGVAVKYLIKYLAH